MSISVCLCVWLTDWALGGGGCDGRENGLPDIDVEFAGYTHRDLY